jgi:hypothetical protein
MDSGNYSISPRVFCVPQGKSKVKIGHCLIGQRMLVLPIIPKTLPMKSLMAVVKLGCLDD